MLTHSWQEAFCISAPMRTKLRSKANAAHTQRHDFDHLVAGLKICASSRNRAVVKYRSALGPALGISDFGRNPRRNHDHRQGLLSRWSFGHTVSGATRRNRPRRGLIRLWHRRSRDLQQWGQGRWPILCPAQPPIDQSC